MPDRYATFAELAAHEREGIDFRRRACKRDERVAVVAPHGGYIEPGTSEITLALAGGTWSFYCFEGLRRGRPHEDLHIASERFDEPIGRAVAEASQIAIGVHGRADRGDRETVWVGGLAFALRDRTAAALEEAGFRATTEGELRGESPSNICNKCRAGAGLQLELHRYCCGIN
jgi:phage replication-related protein YjqB (UPF0714/DUF867 family)